MDILDAVYGFLVYVDVNAAVVGGMAESFTSTDAITWTLKLRDGLKFSDGTAYDADAVKYNWERAADPATAAPTQALHGLLGQGHQGRRRQDADGDPASRQRQFRRADRRVGRRSSPRRPC